jgi:integrase/recombinase XerD
MAEGNGLDAWTEGYLAYLSEVRRLSPGTVRDVRCTLKRVIGVMASLRPGLGLWELTLEDYLGWLEAERGEGRTPRSLNKYLSHVRGLLDYAWRSGRSTRNVLDGFHLRDGTPREAPAALSLDEAQRLVGACAQGTAWERASRVMVLVLYGCGLRTDELCRLDVGDVDRERQELVIRRGKGERQRVVPIPDAVFTELLAYLLERGGKRGALFRTEAKRRRIRARQVCQTVRETARRAGIAWAVTPKTLRHTYATHLMDQGVDLAVIASLMGHRSPAETGVYLHVLPQRPREAVDRLNAESQPGGDGR